MADTPNLPPVIALIRSRRLQPGPLRRPISTRSAARAAEELSGESFSEPTWRRTESGNRADKDIPDRYIVFMAAAINSITGGTTISPDEIEQAGRPEAANLFRQWIRDRTKAEPALSGIDPDLTPESIQSDIQVALREIRSMPGLTTADRKEIERMLLKNVRATLETHQAQLRILRRR